MAGTNALFLSLDFTHLLVVKAAHLTEIRTVGSSTFCQLLFQ